MLIAVPSEITTDETRVALTPQQIPALKLLGCKVQIQSGAGSLAGFSDDDYRKVGAHITATAAETYHNADIILKIWSPLAQETPLLAPKQTIVCNASNLTSATQLRTLAATQITLFALNFTPRTSRAQNVDILSSQSNIAGYVAALTGLNRAPSVAAMMITAAGTLPAQKVLIMGLGVAGLQAAATAHRLGAKVFASDIRRETQDQATSVGAVFMPHVIDELLSSVSLIITTAQTIGKPAPILLNQSQLNLLPNGCVIVDMATESGGNINRRDLSPTTDFVDGRFLERRMPRSASILYGGNMLNFCRLLLKDGQFAINRADDIINHTLICADGHANHPFINGE